MRLDLADESLTERVLELLRSVGCEPTSVRAQTIEFALPHDPALEPWHPPEQAEVELRFLLRAWFPSAAFQLTGSSSRNPVA